ncbi:MAG: TonB-dependent receptor [Bacteroidales bacterium]
MRSIKIFVFIVFFILLFFESFSQVFIVEVKDSLAGTPIPNVNIRWQSVDGKKDGLTTNSKGYAAVSSMADSLNIEVSCVGYKTYTGVILKGLHNTVNLVEDVFNLDEVTVTGTRTPHSLKKTPVLTQLVSRRDIVSTQAATVVDLLATEIPSAEVNRHGFGSSLSSQGLEAKYTLILIDGERMAGESDANVDFSRINTANIERVEIVKGATSSLYGSSAMGSVINIITRKPAKTFDVNVNLRYAEPNEKNNTKAQIDMFDEQYEKTFYRNQDRPNINGDLSVGYRKNSFYTQNYFGYKSSDAYLLYNSKPIVKYYPEIDSTVNEGVEANPSTINGFEDYTITSKVGFDGKNWNGEIRGSYYNHEEFDFSRDWNHNIYRDYSFGAFTQRRFSDSSSLKLSYYYDEYNKFDYMEKKKSAELSYSNVFNHVKLTYTAQLLKKHTMFFGTEFFNEYLKCDRYSSLELDNHSIHDVVVVLQDEYALNHNITLVGAVRGGIHSVHKLHVSPSVSLKMVQGNFIHRVSYARGFRSPTLKELYMNWDHQGMFSIIGNINLKPEVSNYYSVSTDYINTQNLLNVTAIVALNQIYDKIGGVWTNNQTEYHYKNLDDFNVFNAELITRWKFLNSFMLKAGYVYTKVLEKESVARLSETSPHSFTGQLEYVFRKGWYALTSNVTVKVIGRKDISELDEDINTYYNISYPTYSLWNINITQQFKTHLSVAFGIKNLFNYTAPIAGFSTTSTVGRRFHVSVGYNF